MSLTLVSVRDRVAGADGLAPDELLAAVDHHREVDAHLGVEPRAADGAPRVDDREHRRRGDVAEAGRLRLLAVEVDGVVLADRPGVLLDLLLAHLVLERRVGLARSRRSFTGTARQSIGMGLGRYLAILRAPGAARLAVVAGDRAAAVRDRRAVDRAAHAARGAMATATSGSCWPRSGGDRADAAPRWPARPTGSGAAR